MVDPWVVEHKTFIEKAYNDRGQQRTDGDIIKEHNSCFTRWFKQKLLSEGAEHNLMTYEAYDINGYTFYTEAKDMKSDGYQNSGVRWNPTPVMTRTDTTEGSRRSGS